MRRGEEEPSNPYAPMATPTGTIRINSRMPMYEQEEAHQDRAMATPTATIRMNSKMQPYQQDEYHYEDDGSNDVLQTFKRLQPKDHIITIHGYMEKQGERSIQGPWRRRYFALEKAKMYYFQTHLECRQYFTSRNMDLVVGAVELKDALQLRPSARLDLPRKGFEIHTKRRVWVLCPESDEEYTMWFQGVENAIVANGSGNVIERQLPNIRKYALKGVGSYRFFYFLFLLFGIIELGALVIWFSVGIQPCDLSYRTTSCNDILQRSMDKLYCKPQPFNNVFKPPKWWLKVAGVDDVVCFAQPNLGQWISYFCLLLAEFLTFILSTIYYLGMWKPVRRGSHYLNDFEPKLPDEQWPKVDVFITHYSEPAEETIDNLAACMNLQYPPHLLHIYILDDGYCNAKYTKKNPERTIELNKEIIETAGDLRQEIAQFMYDRVCDPNEEMEVYPWRKLHSSAHLPTPTQPRVVYRADCAVGSFRDDYKYSGLPHITFIGRIKPGTHYGKAGNINNALYNEGADGRYVVVLDNDMQPHPKFILATLPFFFDSEERQDKIKFNCVAPGCNRVAKMCCASCKIAGVPESSMSYCSRECFENAMHVESALHRRQVNGTVSDTSGNKKKKLRCVSCNSDVDKNGVCKKCKKSNDIENNYDSAPLTYRYSDSVKDNSVAFVQSPQYFRDCVQLQIGDPLGHRNATFYDSVQTGRDGYDCASYAGTNAIFRREALDSIGGMQYLSLTDDTWTGQKLTSMGWKSLYYRRDFEGEESDRIRLAEGLIPDSVAASLAQKKRLAMGNFQIMLMNKSRNYFDKEWKRPECSTPNPKRISNRFMRRVFYLNSTIYPLGSFSVILFYYVTLYFLYTGYAPIFTNEWRVCAAIVPKLLVQGLLSALSNRSIENNDDVVRSQEQWFVYAFTYCSAVFEALLWKITGLQPRYIGRGTTNRGSLTELLNILIFTGHVVGVIWALVRFFASYNSMQYSHGASLLCAALAMGIFIASKLGPSVRMSIQEYFGLSYTSLTDQGNFIGSSGIAFGLIFITLWVYVEKPGADASVAAQYQSFM